MKFVLKENQAERINKKIYEFIDGMMPSSGLIFEFRVDDQYDKVIKWGENYLTDSTTCVSVYTDDFDSVFKIYLPNYWEIGHPQIDRSPMLVLENNISDPLDSLFGSRWHKPMIDWLKSNFDEIKDIEIKTVE